MENKDIPALLKKYLAGQCTAKESALLESWYLTNRPAAGSELQPEEFIADLQQISIGLPLYRPAKVRRLWPRIAAAAALAACLLVVSYYSLHTRKPETNGQQAKNDIAPGSNTATLTLANGQKIDLSTAAAGKLASQPGAQLFKRPGGQLAYTASGGTADAALNTISVPTGGQWQLVLPDGTKVWLNSASGIIYPTTFAHQKERIVQLAGEAYFEVAKDKQHPFLVKTAQQTVAVLGTHFNINSYADEPSARTTLAEGSVRITAKTGGSALLKPGQQAVLKQGQLAVITANVDDAIAWKDGSFHFTDQNIQSIMRQLSRWYNIEARYEAGVSSEGLNGRISRFKNISQVLKALEATGIVHFKIEGRRVTVMK